LRGSRIAGHRADDSPAAGCAALAKQVAAREQRLHILVNNAGAACGGSIAEYIEAGWDKIFDTNVRSVFFFKRELLPLLFDSSTNCPDGRNGRG
jgi:NAD(P)-dependent dehydrogenase (short-subunit alcohol dehydrogenase family)